MFHQKSLHKRRDAWVGILSWWSCQSPVAHSYGFLNHLNSFHGGMFKLNAKFYAHLLLYSLSHFECDGHTVQMLTQWCLLLPLTSTVKSPLFTHAHSSPLSLAARLHRCHTNCSHYINNGRIFPDRPHIYIREVAIKPSFSFFPLWLLYEYMIQLLWGCASKCLMSVNM